MDEVSYDRITRNARRKGGIMKIKNVVIGYSLEKKNNVNSALASQPFFLTVELKEHKCRKWLDIMNKSISIEKE